MSLYAYAQLPQWHWGSVYQNAWRCGEVHDIWWVLIHESDPNFVLKLYLNFSENSFGRHDPPSSLLYTAISPPDSQIMLALVP